MVKIINFACERGLRFRQQNIMKSLEKRPETTLLFRATHEETACALTEIDNSAAVSYYCNRTELFYQPGEVSRSAVEEKKKATQLPESPYPNQPNNHHNNPKKLYTFYERTQSLK